MLKLLPTARTLKPSYADNATATVGQGNGYTGDPLRQLVYCEIGSDLDTIIVDGEIVMRDGKLTRIDETAILAEARAAYEELRPAIDAAEAAMSEMCAAYKKIYHRCLGHEIAPDTHPARFP